MHNTARESAEQPPRDTNALRKTVEAYSEELTARHSLLLDDLAIYQAKLRDLKQLDPLDFTGLQHLYTAHVSQIENLLTEFDAAED